MFAEIQKNIFVIITKISWFALVIGFLSEHSSLRYVLLLHRNFMNIRLWHVLVRYFFCCCFALFATTCCEPTTHFEICCCFFLSDIIAFIWKTTNSNMYVHVKIYAELVDVCIWLWIPTKKKQQKRNRGEKKFHDFQII